jgi:hypothetical protein
LQEVALLCKTRVEEDLMMAYQVKSRKSGETYYLHRRKVVLRGGREQTIYFFARQEKDGAIDECPPGYVVMENERTGLPMLKKQTS